MRRIGAALLALVLGCGQVHEETRVERGALLRAFERDRPSVPGGIRVRPQVSWPRLTLKFTSFEVCRHEQVNEYAEDHVTEKSAPSAGPELATGVSTTLIGLGLFLARGLFSNAPNTRNIDGGGNYGASDRTNATGWSYALMIIGIPALAMGTFGMVQTGDKVKTERVEEIASAKESPCNEQPVDGAVELSSSQGGGPPAVLHTQAGSLVMEDSQLRNTSLGAVMFEGKPALLSEDEQAVVEHYLACLRVLPAPPPEILSQWPRTQLEAAADSARDCESVPGAPVKDVSARLRAELERRSGGPTGPVQGPRIASFEDALAAYAPELKLIPGGDPPSRLTDGSVPAGTAVLLQGLLIERLEANIALLDISGVRALVFIPAQSPWSSNLDNGSRVDVVGVAQGRQTLGSVEAPLIRAVWIRPGM